MKRVGINILLVITMIVSLLLPFNYIRVYAFDSIGSLDQEIIGWNIYPIQIIADREYNTSLGNLSGTFESNNSSAVVVGPLTASNGVTYYSSGINPGGQGLNLEGTITLNNSGGSSTATTLHKGLYKCEVVFAHEYVGTLDIRLRINNVEVANDTLSINGSSAYFTFMLNEEVTNAINGTIQLSILNWDIVLNDSYYKTWSFPIETLSFANYMLSQNYSIIGINENNNYYFPIMRLNQGDKVYSFYRGGGTNTWRMKVRLRVNARMNDINDFNSVFEYNFSNVTIENIQGYNSGTSANSANSSNMETILFFDYVTTRSGSDYFLKVKGTYEIMPIYWQRDTFKAVSTDFALLFGLTNPLLDNIDKIANGTTQSNNSISNATSTNTQASNIFTQEETLVNNAENDLDDKLDALDISNKNNDLYSNSSFIASANWVKAQFDYLTNNNAFNYMITFSLVVGLALVIVGKLRG